jgi:beta-lactamase class A
MKILIILFLFFAGIAFHSCRPKKDIHTLNDKIASELAKNEGIFAVAFKDLTTGEFLFINEKEHFHAASTMKTPVLIELYNQANAGKFTLEDSLVVKNEFKSIVDGSSFSLSPDDDSDQELYEQIGKKRTIAALAYDMIVVSSNLATNIVIELVDAKKVTQTMRSLGAMDIEILRGVEDQKAYDQGMSNTTTAYDLLLIFEALANRELVSSKASDEMITILQDQHFNGISPAHLPKDVKVAHKTGSITGVHHDSGSSILPDGRLYVWVVLCRVVVVFEGGTAAMGMGSAVLCA